MNNNLGVNSLTETPKEPFDNIPAEIRGEMRFYESDKLMESVRIVLQERKEPMTLNDILMGLYNRFSLPAKRAQVSMAVNRLVRRNMIQRVPKRRGLYTIATANATTAEENNNVQSV